MQILQLLADGQFHSGEELGLRLGVSRAAVWKQISVWRKRGVQLEVVPGKGYRLIDAMERWSEESLLLNLSPSAKSRISLLVIEDRVGSTNDVVAAHMRGSRLSGVVCLAEEQTAGRGRRGREWYSPLGQNFYGSVGWVFGGGVAAIEGLSLAVGVAVVRALRRYGMNCVQLKWPNDLVVGEAKLGGVLIELQAEAGGPCQVIVGVGVNLKVPAGVSERLGRAVTDIASHIASPIKKNEIGGLLLDELLMLLDGYSSGGFKDMRYEWLTYDALSDAEVIVLGLDGELAGIARGVDDHGALILETTSGFVSLHGGEVSLRKRQE